MTRDRGIWSSKQVSTSLRSSSSRGMLFLFLLLALLQSTAVFAAPCASYAQRCSVEVGKVFGDSANQGAIQLNNGKSFYFTMSPATGTQYIDLDLTLFYGDVEIYIAKDREPKRTDYDNSNVRTGELDHLRFAYDASVASTTTNVFITAVGGSASFTGLVTTPATSDIEIFRSLPQKVVLEANSVTRFLSRVQSKDSTGNVLITAFSTAASATSSTKGFQYPRMSVSLPSTSSPLTSSDGFVEYTTTGSDVGKNVEISLTAVNRTVLTIVTRELPTSAKYPVIVAQGQLQRDRITTPSSSHYYTFTVPSDVSGRISFILESLEGDCDLYVNPSVKGFYHREGVNGVPDDYPVWASQRPGSSRDSIMIAEDDSNYIENGGQYYISVYGYTSGEEGAGGVSAEYTLRVKFEDSVLTLSEDLPLVEYVEKGKYNYYKFTDVTSVGGGSDSDSVSAYDTLIIDVTPMSGDADLYISCRIKPTGDESGYPSNQRGHYNYSSAMYQEDSISLSPHDSRSCPPSLSSDAVYYIAIYGYSNAMYALTVTHTMSVRPLVPGTPVVSTIYRHLSQRFRLRVGAEAEDLVITLSPSYGDCDLYVKMGISDTAGKQGVEGEVSMPIAYLYDYDYRSGAMGTTVDRIHIEEDMICTNCYISILVYGFETTQYSLLAQFTDTVVSLTNGLAVKSAVGSAYTQYYTYTPSQDSTLTTTLTVYHGDQPGIYMSASPTVTQPNRTSPATARRYSDSDDGIIPILSLPHCVAGQPVVIAIAGEGHNASYTVRVHEVPDNVTSAPTLLRLVEGQPQNDAITIADRSAYLYYVIPALPGHESITVRATSLVGEVDLYIKKCTAFLLRGCAQLNALPSIDSYSLTSEGLDKDVIDIARNDAKETNYIIAARSTSYYSAFQMSFGTSKTILEMQAGVAATDHVVPGELDYFSFYFSSYRKSTLKIALTPISGDPDLFVSTTHRYPSAGNSTWRSFRFGSDIITIDPSKDSDACNQCTYYIAVVGSTESTYSLVVTVEDTWTVLQDGLPSTSHVSYFSWDYFKFSASANSNGKIPRSYRIAVTPSTGNPDIYVTLDGSTPGFLNHAYFSTHWSGAEQIDILPSDPQFAPCNNVTKSCVIKMSVYGFLASDYTISITSSIASTLLPLDRVNTGSVGENGNTFYRVMLSEQSSLSTFTLRISLTPTSGHVSLYVTCDNTVALYANESMWSIESVSVGGDVLEIPSLSVRDHGCLRSSGIFYLTVHGDHSAASFNIQANVVRNTTVTQLIGGQSMTGSLHYHYIDYYYIRPGTKDYANLFMDARLIVTALQGDVDLYIGKDWDHRPVFSTKTGQINTNSYVMKSASVGDEDLSISHDAILDICDLRKGSYAALDCYFIVAVVGVYGESDLSLSSRYSLLLSWKDSMVQLISGVPQRGHVTGQRMEYYKFSLMQINYDVVFSLSALYGDPDLFISMAPITHPTRSNFTWAQAMFGGDTITVQYQDITKRCTPVPSTGKGCDFYVGVYGWKNSSYTLTAKVDDGFRTPTLLLDQHPQSGHVDLGGYQYYKYLVSVDPPGPRSKAAPIDIKFVLTPTDGGDQDLYLKFATDDMTEPGKTSFDMKSASWSTVAEQIEIKAGMSQYCIDCVIYLAVYGYTGGSYTLQATSTGMITLQPGDSVGGAVMKGKFEYYSYYNPDPFAEMMFSVTLVTGDADLYITTRKKGDKTFKMPSKTDFTWRSLSFGADTILIDYSDSKYCVECEYIVGVYGYANASYSLTVSEKKASVIKLSPNMPLHVSMTEGEVMYFTTPVTSSLADVTVSLTPSNTGQADLYIAIKNLTQISKAIASANDPRHMLDDDSTDRVYHLLPDPYDYTTYDYTTEGTEDNHIYLSRPHSPEDIIAITVKALSDIDFALVSAINDRPVVLQAGMPQNHFVDQGQNEVFMFYPDSDEDVRISLTARTGDPDLFISATDPNPHCRPGASNFQVICTNYTWSSRMFYTDQIVISRDVPCTPVLPTTYIVPSCDADSDKLGGFFSLSPSLSPSPLYIGVYGYRASKFTLVASPLGAHVKLLAGSPQLGMTSPGWVCSKRSESTGACTASSSVKRKVQVSYFTFTVAHTTTTTNTGRRRLGVIVPVKDVMLSVSPSCNASRNSMDGEGGKGVCAPGCSCNPLTVYVSSCTVSRCTELDRKPSDLLGQHKAALTVLPASGGSTLFISSSDLEQSNGDSSASSAYCDPDKAGEDCVYFIAVSHNDDKVPATFTITARTPGDVSLIPCDARTYPDGIKVIAPDVISGRGASGPSSRYYEICSQQSAATPSKDPNRSDSPSDTNPNGDSLIVELEQCSGNTALYACADDNSCASMLPSSASYGYYADHSQACTRVPGSSKDKCVRSVLDKTVLRLPARIGSYFVLANSSLSTVTSRYNLQVRTTYRGIDLSPRVVYAGMQDLAESGTLSLLTVTGNTVTLSWRQSRVLMPASGSGSLSLIADEMAYTAWIFDMSLSEVRAISDSLSTATAPCAIEYLASTLPSRGWVKAVVPLIRGRGQGGEEDYTMSHRFSNLMNNRRYLIRVLSECDALCLRQLSKVISNPRVLISCNGGDEDCKPQRLLYNTITITTAMKADPVETDDDSQSNAVSEKSHTLTIVASLLGVLMIGAMGYAMYYWYKVTRSEDGEELNGVGAVFGSLHGYVMEMVAFTGVGSSSNSSTTSASSHGSSHGSSSSHGLTSSTTSSSSSSGYMPPGSQSRGNGIWSTISSSARNLSSYVSKPTGQGQGAPNSKYAPLSAQQRAGSAFVVEDEDDIDITL